LGVFRVPSNHDRAAWAEQRLVCRAGDDVRIIDGVRIYPRDDESCGMGNVREEDRADFVRGLSELLPVGCPRVGRISRDDHLRPVFLRKLQYFVVFELPRRGADPVGDDTVVLSGTIEFASVREVASVHEVHSHDDIAGLHEGVIDRVIRRRAG
jgi:hypothetical protein